MGVLYFFFFKLFLLEYSCFGSSQVVLVVKNPIAHVRDVRNECSIPWLGRSPGGGHGNTLQYSCPENPMNRGAWQATVHGVAESDMTEWLHFPFLSILIRLDHWQHWTFQWESSRKMIPSFSSTSVTQLCLTLWDTMNRSTTGLPVHHQLPEFAQTHVHWVSDAIQPSHPLSFPSPPAPNPSQHQGLFQWVSSSHEVAKVLEFQLQHQYFQWTPRTDLL